MDSKKYVGRRRGYALALVVALIIFMTVLLGVAISHLEYYSGLLEAHSSRSQARSALESLTNLSLKWLSAKVNGGARPRASAAVNMIHMSDFDSLCVFTSNFIDGCEVNIYDLDYNAENATKHTDASRIFPPSLPGGYMIRAAARKENLAHLTLESVYVVTSSMLPGGASVDILDEKPVYWRELFR